MNTGPGWYEVINPRNATTCIALVYEDGSIYLPEGDALNREEFAFSAARGNVHRLVRAEDCAELEAENERLRADLDAYREYSDAVARELPTGVGPTNASPQEAQLVRDLRELRTELDAALARQIAAGEGA